MHRLVASAALMLCLAGLALPAAQAQSADVSITMEADDGDSCLEEEAVDCFRVTEGSLDNLQTGMLVHITLQNVGNNPHNVYVTEQENADTDTRDTSGGDAINGSDTIGSGEETTLVFTVPDEAEGLYFWCDVDTHETLGMYLSTDVEQAPPQNDTDDQDDQEPDDEAPPDPDDGSENEEGIPFPGPALILASLAAAAAKRRT